MTPGVILSAQPVTENHLSGQGVTPISLFDLEELLRATRAQNRELISRRKLLTKLEKATRKNRKIRSSIGTLADRFTTPKPGELYHMLLPPPPAFSSRTQPESPDTNRQGPQTSSTAPQQPHAPHHHRGQASWRQKLASTWQDFAHYRQALKNDFRHVIRPAVSSVEEPVMQMASMATVMEPKLLPVFALSALANLFGHTASEKVGVDAHNQAQNTGHGHGGHTHHGIAGVSGWVSGTVSTVAMLAGTAIPLATISLLGATPLVALGVATASLASVGALVGHFTRTGKLRQALKHLGWGGLGAAGIAGFEALGNAIPGGPVGALATVASVGIFGLFLSHIRQWRRKGRPAAGVLTAHQAPHHQHHDHHEHHAEPHESGDGHSVHGDVLAPHSSHNTTGKPTAVIPSIEDCIIPGARSNSPHRSYISPSIWLR